ncbi:MAG TPA: transcription termination factor Rho [Acidimicrobiales bacterium]|nr:transcription termination factor Rho [Acidimicrobiales bacterium]
MLERSVLERKERDELHTIAEALGVKPGARTKKADLIQTILVAAGVEAPEAAAPEKPKRTRAPRAAVAVAEAAPSSGEIELETPDGVPSPNGIVEETGNSDADFAESLGVDEAIEQAVDDDQAPISTEGSNGSSSELRRNTEDRGPRSPQSQPQQNGGQARPPQPQGQQPAQGPGQAGQGSFEEGGSRRGRRRRGRDQRGGDRDFRMQEQSAETQYQGDLVPVSGLLDLTDQGYGYVRTKGYLPSPRDVYVSTSQAKRFALRKGDQVEGEARPPLGNEKFGALLRIETVSGQTVDEARQRPRFEDLTPLFPDVKLKMEQPSRPHDITARIVDLISPIGKGQRGLIVSPPKAGKTTVIKQIATSIEANNPDVHLMILLVDERPEEVTDMRRHVKGEVVASTFDRPSDEHTLLAELAIERAKRLVEKGQDVVIILDGITRLARAYNLSAPASGRLTSGGIDQAAIYPPKKFFGAARNIEEGGSLTILATALVETGSKADDVIFEEFKGTGNMELRLDRRLAERRIYPAIDVNASSTRHEELLFERKQLELVYRLRRVLNGLADDGSAARSLELLIEKLKTTKNNDEFLAEVAKAQGGPGI